MVDGLNPPHAVLLSNKYRLYLRHVCLFIAVESVTGEKYSEGSTPTAQARPRQGRLATRNELCLVTFAAPFILFNDIDWEQRLCIILARRPKFLTWQFAVFLVERWCVCAGERQ